MADATISNVKILYYGLQANYDALQTKDADKLYFCTDSKKIFKGEVEMTEQVRFVNTKTGLTPVAGKLYIIADTGTVEIWNGSAWTVVSYPIVKSVAGSGEGISVASTDVEVPSAKAVYDYVQGIIAGDSVVTAVTSSVTAGYIDVTTGDDAPVPTVIPGVVTTPSYNAVSRTFTFPISDDPTHPVVVELGKDIFIDPEANNRYENGNIYLYLNDGTGSKDPTEIVIPVTSLVTDYFGDDTASIEVDIDNTTHKVTASARIRPDVATPGSEFTNLLKVSSVTGAEGLYVDAAPVEANTAAIALLNDTASVTGSVAYAVKQLADGQVATNTAAIQTLNGDATVTGSVDQKVKAASDALDTRVTANEGAIEVINGADSVTGSIAHAVKELADGQVATNTAAITTLNGNSTVTGSVDQKIAALETSKVDVNAANIQVLATAQSWGTF